MPDLPISGLPTVTVPNRAYTVAAVSASVTSQMTLAQVAAAISSSFTASQAISASYATSASYEINYETSSSYADTASFVTASNVYGPFGSSSILSASYAVSASYAPFQVSASYATTASYALTSVSASYAVSSSNAETSSYAITASHWLGSSNYTPTAYLAAFHTASLTIPTPNTPNTMSFSTVDFAQGVTISGSWSDKIKVTNGGVYNIQFSAATTKNTGTAATIDIWLRKNESDLSYTNTIVTLAGGSNDFAIPAWNFFVSASAGDYYQLMFASPTTNPYIAYAASGSTGVAVQVPSVILTVNRIA